MNRTRRKGSVFGATLVMAALAFGSVGVHAQETVVGLPSTPTGYAELDQALDGTKPFNGTKVSIQTQWVAGEGANFRETLAAFEAATGIDVQFDEIGSSHETVLKTRIDGNAPPDLAVIAQPTNVIKYGQAGSLVDVATIMDIATLTADHGNTVPLYTDGDHVWAIPYKVDVKGVVWYPIKAFETASYAVPQTWDELIALSDRIVAEGKGSPWCIGMEAGTATGWQATDWVEELMLRTSGPEVYEKWITGEVKFDSPEVREAFDKVAQIFFTPGYVFGGNTAIIATSQRTPMDPMFNEDMANPGCWMQNIPFWYGPEFFPDARAAGGSESKFVVGEDVGIFVLPPIDPAKGVPALGSGDGLMVLRDRPEVRAVAQFLATPAGIETWVRKGAAMSANTAVPTEWYQGNYELELASSILANAPSFSFDASDLMPPAVGAGTFWTEIVKWIQANGEGTETFLQAIDASWPSS